MLGWQGVLVASGPISMAAMLTFFLCFQRWVTWRRPGWAFTPEGALLCLDTQVLTQEAARKERGRQASVLPRGLMISFSA